MSEPKPDSLNELLSSFALGPAWARATSDDSRKRSAAREDRSAGRTSQRDDSRGGKRDDRREGRGRDDSRGYGRDGGAKGFRGRGDQRDGRRQDGPPRSQEILPAPSVRVTLLPDAEAVHLIGKEVHQVARVYPLFDVAQILLAERGRCRAIFEVSEPQPPLLHGKLDESIFLTREEAARHLWHSELRGQFLEEETIEVDPPRGNFQLVARCGLSGEWLGPPNFHTYQSNLRRIHRERYASMPFAAYTAKVRTERGEEAVQAWLDTMKQKARWRIKGEGDDAWMDDRTDAERALANRCFEQAFEETRRVEVSAAITPRLLSPALMASLKQCGNHARNHPAILIPAICKALEAEHLPVFKRQGKLFTGPARPHPLPPGAVLAERPGIMVEWIRNNKPAKLEGLWKAVLPEGGTAPPAEYAADLFWLLQQGHILLFTDDTLVVQELREEAPSSVPDGEAKPKKKKRKKKKPHATELAADQATAAADAEEPENDGTHTPAAADLPMPDDEMTKEHEPMPEQHPVSDAVPEPEPEPELPGHSAVQLAESEIAPESITQAVSGDEDLQDKNSAGVDESPIV